MIRIKSNLLMLLPAVGLILIMTSCDPSASYVKEEKSKIDHYLSQNSGLAFEQKPSGLYYLDIQAGTGKSPVANDTVYVKYTGKYLNGVVFDSNVDVNSYLKFPVGQGTMIEGIEEGITYMKEGGKALMIIPSKLAYGPTGFYQIPGYTPLLFELQLVAVKAGPTK